MDELGPVTSRPPVEAGVRARRGSTDDARKVPQLGRDRERYQGHTGGPPMAVSDGGRTGRCAAAVVDRRLGPACRAPEASAGTLSLRVRPRAARPSPRLEPGVRPTMPARRTLLLALGGVTSVLALIVAAVWLTQQGRVLPNTTLAGVEVGGLTPDEVAEAIRPVAEARAADEITFTFEDERFTATPADVGYEVDLDASVAAAMDRGRQGPLRDVPTRLAALVRDAELELVESWDRDAVADHVATIAEEVDRETSFGAVRADPDTLEVRTRLPEGAAVVRQDDAIAAFDAAVDSPGDDELELPVDTEPQPLADEDVEAVADQVEAAIAEPLELRGEGETLTVSPEELAELIRVAAVEEDEPRLEIRISEGRVEETLGERAREVFDRAPVDAQYVTDRTPPTSFDTMGSTSFSPVEVSVGIEEGRTGLAFDPAAAAERLTELVRDGARDGDVEIEVTEPDLPTAQAEEQRPTHLLGTFTTYYQAGQVRNQNIQRLADVVDGAQVLPGEQFSINDISGERTCDKGYQPAGTIVRGELVDTCGGGVSQFGTTTFNAAFFSGLQLDQWQAHSFYISRYPMGREATLSYPALDVRFTNTSDGVVVVRTTHTSTSVTVSIYGQPVADRVSASHGEPFNRRSPTTETRNTSSLPSGQTRTIQSPGSGGFTIEVVRTVDRTDGSSDSQTIRTVYVPQNGIVERGTG
ncbi:hypothetical protein FTX61_08605 [Nitriliruptoraceae bacterium ZYF776]|nr:hypothetical protein [Profundirhabdus halotolerans]